MTSKFENQKSNGYLYPQFICRVGGLPVNSLITLKTTETESILKIISDNYLEFKLAKNRLTELLFTKIGNSSDKKVRGKLLSLKRDINNLDYLNNRVFKYHSFDLDEEAMMQCNTLSGIIEKREVLLERYRIIFSEELVSSRNEFKKLIENEDFQKGLLISSRSLFSTQKIYKNSDSRIEDPRIEQIERGMLRYFSRMVMKATPFSTFCSIIPGYFEKSEDNDEVSKSIFRLEKDPSKKKSEVLLNKSIFGSIVEYLFSNSGIRVSLYVEKNPTILAQENNLRYLTSINGKEVFQQLQINEVIELLCSVLDNTGKLKLMDLMEILKNNQEIDATAEEISAYLNKLIEIGFLRFTLGIPDQEINWPYSLIEILDSIDNENALKLSKFLKELMANLKSYSLAGANERTDIIETMNKEIKGLFGELGIKEIAKADLPVYEDATANSKAFIKEDDLADITRILFKMVNTTKRVCYPRTEQATMRHFFDSFYQENNSEISLLRFYEDFYREHFKSHLEKQAKLKANVADEELKKYNVGNPFNLVVINNIFSFQKGLHKLIVDKWNQDCLSEEINISLYEYEELVSNIPELVSPCYSTSAFINLILPDKLNDIPRMFLKNCHYMLGYGKFFSRFIYLFTKHERQLMIDSNNAMSKSFLAEISCDANFNANLHPPLLNFEIVYPTGDGGMAVNKIFCNNIIVKHNPFDEYSLILEDKESGKQIVPMDLGFLNPTMRPPLFQLLSRFTPASNFGINIPENNFGNIKHAETKKDSIVQIIYRPRVVLENLLILSRKCWFVPTELFPTIKPGETNSEYFVRVNLWRMENNIPDQVYIRVKPLPLNNNGITDKQENESEQGKIIESNIEEGAENNMVSQLENTEIINEQAEVKTPSAITTEQMAIHKKRKGIKQSRDYFKPQFIDFSNPLFVNLFGKLTGTLKNYTVTLEECYPKEEQLPQYDTKSFVTELIMQLNFPENEMFLSRTEAEVSIRE